jgi:hypothetical protein
MVIFLVLGVIQSFNLLNDLYYLKFPQPWLKKVCADHGWVPLIKEGEPATFDTRAEIQAVKYVGGRFVKYTTTYSWERFHSTLIKHDDIETDIESLDPLKTNGQAMFILLSSMMLGATFLGYGQACADTNTKEYYKEAARENEIKAYNKRISTAKMGGNETENETELSGDEMNQARNNTGSTYGWDDGTEASVMQHAEQPTRNVEQQPMQNDFGADEVLFVPLGGPNGLNSN